MQEQCSSPQGRQTKKLGLNLKKMATLESYNVMQLIHIYILRIKLACVESIWMRYATHHCCTQLYRIIIVNIKTKFLSSTCMQMTVIFTEASNCDRIDNIMIDEFEHRDIAMYQEHFASTICIYSRPQCGPRGGGSYPTPPNVCVHTKTKQHAQLGYICYKRVTDYKKETKHKT